MARHHERYAPDYDTHGIGDTARRHAEEDYREQFGTGRRTQNTPEDYGTTRSPEPFDRGYRDQYGRYDERYGERTHREPVRGYRGRGPRNYTRSDERILEDVCERLWNADDVDASDVTVEVQNGEVTLRGNVEQRRIRHRIEDIADDCGGVTDIHNEIRVQPRNEWPYDKGVAPGTDLGNGPASGAHDEGMVQSAMEQKSPRG
ncbi:MAG: BON domain-containing protein [Rhodanobacteraceae bacterium]